MKAKKILAWMFVLVATGSVAAAQNPFVGTWKLNPAKSKFAGITLKFGPAQSNAIELTTGGTMYSFRVDGNNYRMASGDLASWKQVDPATWTTSYLKLDGTPLNTDTWTISPDDQTLTVETTGVKPNGDHSTDTATYARTAGTSGLLGTWKSTTMKFSSPEELQITAYSLGGLSIKMPSTKTSLLANFDGKAVVPEGPVVPPGLTIALFRIGPSTFRLVRKINGNAAYSARFAVSSDGRTMTETGNSPGDPSQIRVWEKQ